LMGHRESSHHRADRLPSQPWARSTTPPGPGLPVSRVAVGPPDLHGNQNASPTPRFHAWAVAIAVCGMKRRRAQPFSRTRQCSAHWPATLNHLPPTRCRSALLVFAIAWSPMSVDESPTFSLQARKAGDLLTSPDDGQHPLSLAGTADRQPRPNPRAAAGFAVPRERMKGRTTSRTFKRQISTAMGGLPPRRSVIMLDMDQGSANSRRSSPGSGASSPLRDASCSSPPVGFPPVQHNQPDSAPPLVPTAVVPLAPIDRDPPALTLAPWPRETGPQLSRDRHTMATFRSKYG
jgi:hypothetical protein